MPHLHHKNHHSIPLNHFIFFFLSLVSLLLSYRLFQIQTNPNTQASGTTWTVSKSGGGNWTELNQINWSTIQPGDTILINPGTYTTTLSVTRSGTSSDPITIRATGRVNIFGGRSTPLPECSQSNYTYQTSGVRTVGVYFGNSDWVVLDGGSWNGLSIYGHNRYGIELGSGSDHITIKNVEIYDNGTADYENGRWDPNQEGVRLSGTNHLFERVHIHDNGQDAMQSGGGVGNFRMNESWLYNKRPHSTARYADGSGPLPFNHCTHSDGVQIYGGGDQYGVTVTNSIIGPGFLQGLLLGEVDTHVSSNIHDVTITNVLFFGNTNASMMGYDGSPSRNWRLDRVTSVRPAFPSPAGCSGGSQCCLTHEKWHNLYVQGSGHSVTNSILYGGCQMSVPSSTSRSNNCQASVKYGVSLGTNSNPQFRDTSNNFSQSDFGDFTPLSSSCTGKGSSLTSVTQFLNMVQSQSTGPTSTPPATPSLIPTLPPTTNLTREAETGLLTAGTLTSFNLTTSSPGFISQPTETTNPLAGGKASYVFSIPTSGNYLVNISVRADSTSSDSLFVNFDAEPAVDHIWDIGPTSGFQTRTVSWRGTGSTTSPQFSPKLFYLTAGNHTLILRGREASLQIDSITLQPSTPPTPIPTITPTPTSTPIPTTTPTPTPIPAPATDPNLPITTFEAESGKITYPFVIFDGRVSQSDETLDPSQGGKATYTVNIPASGNYIVKMVIDTPSSAYNSVFINFDSEPSSPNMVWDMPITSSAGTFETHTVTNRGNGSESSPQYNPKVYSLSAGSHQLILRGRERRARIDKIQIFPAP